MTMTPMTPITPMTADTADTPDNGAGAATMRAVTQDRYGDSSVLELSDVERPSVGDDQVLIEVRAAGVDRGVEHLMTGTPYLVRLAGYGLTKPKRRIPGLDVAGRVVAVGASVSRFSVGDEVFGIADGSFAEYAAADEAKLSLKPADLSFEQAAASAVSGITALQALTDVGGAEAGQRVLVVGASGGVGSFAVQIAAALGAVVDGVAGASNLDLVRSLGARDVFDHRTTRLVDIGRTYDLVIDVGGRNPIRSLRRVMEPDGTLVIVGGEDGNRITGGIGRQVRAMLLSPFVQQRLTAFISSEHHSSIDRLADLMATGDVVPAVSATYPLDRAADALRAMADGAASGKSVIVVRTD